MSVTAPCCADVYARITNEIIRAIEKVTLEGRVRTPDLGGSSNTADMTKALLDAL